MRVSIYGHKSFGQLLSVLPFFSSYERLALVLGLGYCLANSQYRWTIRWVVLKNADDADNDN